MIRENPTIKDKKMTQIAVLTRTKTNAKVLYIIDQSVTYAASIGQAIDWVSNASADTDAKVKAKKEVIASWEQSLDFTDADGAQDIGWAHNMEVAGINYTVHNTKGTKYIMGYPMARKTIEAGEAKKPTNHRNEKTAAKAQYRRALKWTMLNVDNAYVTTDETEIAALIRDYVGINV